MKTLVHHLPTLGSRHLALTSLVASFALANPAFVAADDSAQSQAAKVVTAPAASSHRVAMKMAPDAESVETRIKYLHGKFAITPAQDEAWNKVAAQMRENADKITALVKSRADNAKTMTAVDDLKAYADISGAHEDGTQKLIPAFTALYESMSSAQKLVADAEFRSHGHSPGAHGHAAS